MASKLNPIVSEFPTQDAADSYDLWFRAKVETALRRADDPTTARFTTDEVLRRVTDVIRSAQAEHDARRLA